MAEGAEAAGETGSDDGPGEAELVHKVAVATIVMLPVVLLAAILFLSIKR